MNGERSLVNRVEHGQQPRAVSSGTTPLVPVAGENADGGEGIGTADCPSVRKPPRIVCRPGMCDICDDRRDLQWQYMEDPL